MRDGVPILIVPESAVHWSKWRVVTIIMFLMQRVDVCLYQFRGSDFLEKRDVDALEQIPGISRGQHVEHLLPYTVVVHDHRHKRGLQDLQDHVCDCTGTFRSFGGLFGEPETDFVDVVHCFWPTPGMDPSGSEISITCIFIPMPSGDLQRT